MSDGDQTDPAGHATRPGDQPAGAAGQPVLSQARPPARRRPVRAPGPAPERIERPPGPPATDSAVRSSGPSGPSGPSGESEPDTDRGPVPGQSTVEPVIEMPGEVRSGAPGGGGGRGPTARRVTRNGSGPPVGPIAILAIAGVVLVILLVVILLSRGDEPRLETAAPCIQASVSDALTEIADGGVTNIRASAAANDLSQFAVAVELDIEGGGCLSLPQGPESVDQRTAIIGAATIYNSQTEGRQINIEIDGIDVPPTATPAPLPTDVPPTEVPDVPTSELPVVPATEVPIGLPPPATPATPLVASPIA